MKGKAIIPLVLGLGVGLLAVKMLVDTLKKARASGADQRMVTVVRAKQDIGELEEITTDLVEQIEVADTKLIPANERMATAEEVIGRVTSKSIPRQSPILKSMLSPEGTESGMAGRIQPGYRAVSVKIDEASAVAFQVKPGDWVDVIVVMDVQSNNRQGGGSKKQTIAEVILQKVQVGAIGQITSGGAGGATADAKVKPAKSATLIVKEEDVPKLHLAGIKGKITLAMRGADDSVANVPVIARESEVFSYGRNQDESEEPPAKPEPRLQPKANLFANIFKPAEPEPPHGVTVYHGAPSGAIKVEQFMFENSKSRNLLSISDGPGSRAATLFGGVNRSRPQDTAPPQPENVKTPPSTKLDETTPPPPGPAAESDNPDDPKNNTLNEG